MEPMDAAQALTELGSTASYAELMRLTTRGRVRTALAAGQVVRLGTGRYALPHVAAAYVAAARLGGTVSHLSAAVHWGWKIKSPPEQPTVTVPRNRCGLDTDGVEVHWADLMPDQRDRHVTTPIQTVVDCARAYEPDIAQCVADSALRGGLRKDELLAAAQASPRTGRTRALQVITAADGRSANPFESVLRKIALEAGLDVQPQQWVGGSHRIGRVDLLDIGRRLVIEAESFEFHSGRRALARDVHRYTAMVHAGFVVVRFTWEDVMFHPDEVRGVLLDLARDLPRLGAVRPRKR
jgi:very-short-patch-repair endonuclease